MTPFVKNMCLRFVWVCAELKAIPGHGFSFGSQSAYTGGKSMYGIFLLWNNFLLLFISYIFCPLARICWGTHDNGNPASCSLCFLAPGLTATLHPWKEKYASLVFLLNIYNWMIDSNLTQMVWLPYYHQINTKICISCVIKEVFC